MKINLVVWGLGKHSANKVIDIIKKTKKINLYGIYTRNQKLLKKISKKYKCNSWKSSNEMLNDKKINVVYLATPIGFHFSEGKRILLSGKHFWCEKSLACSYEQVKSLVRIAKKRNLAICESFMYLHHPMFKKIKDLLVKKIIGSPYFVNFNFFCPHLERTNWRYKNKLGGGALLDLGCYPISSYLNLFNLNLKIFFALLKNESSYKVDTYGLVFIKNKNTFFKLNWGFGYLYENKIKIFGSKGILEATPFYSKPFNHRPIIKIYKNNVTKKIIFSQTNHFIEMLNSFSDIINDKKKRNEQYKICSNQSKLIDEVRKRNSFNLFNK